MFFSKEDYMQRDWNVDHISIPPIGFKARTQADGLRRMGVVTSDDAMPGNAVYTLKEQENDDPTHVVFFTESSDKWDYVSTIPNGGQYILEQWEGSRSYGDIGFLRHTFVRRTPDAGYEYLGAFVIKALFGEPKHQITLWERR